MDEKIEYAKRKVVPRKEPLDEQYVCDDKFLYKSHYLERFSYKRDDGELFIAISNELDKL